MHLKKISFILCAFGVTGCALLSNGEAVRPSSLVPSSDLRRIDASATQAAESRNHQDCRSSKVSDTKSDQADSLSGNAIIDKCDTLIADTTQNMDFGSAISIDSDLRSVPHPIEDRPKIYPSAKSFTVPSVFVRLCLIPKTTQVTIRTNGDVSVGRGRSFSGSISVRRGSQNLHIEDDEGNEATCALPCTLATPNHTGTIRAAELTCRGSIIIAASGTGTFSVVNYASVEDYLRGVVPLEIGTKNADVIEAIKAQAVAARTYTYKRISERKNESWDVMSTVADQVFGGTEAETESANKAISDTRDIIMTYAGEPICAYYHSTCGGHTADITSVWGKRGMPYLKQADDLDRNGTPWCAASPMYNWRCAWSIENLSQIMRRNSRSSFPNSTPFTGTIKNISIESTTSDGRVTDCRVETDEGLYSFGGDKIRFLIRRPTAGNPILQSSWFVVDRCDRDSVVISGKGYGHGIGMCQMGAIGRAHAGWDFRSILLAYYSGVDFACVRSGKSDGSF